MKHVSILLLNDVNLGSLENARQGFLEANHFLSTQGKPPYFEVELVGVSDEVHLNNGLYLARPDNLVHKVAHTDLIIIPPVQHNILESLDANSKFIPWINEQYQAGAEVVSLCLGAFILGATGLLDGRDCVTHWKAAGQFQKLFPKSKLITDKLITDDRGIYTGGGAFSSANLVLYLIEKYAGRDTAIYCSKIFQIDMGRHTQTPFTIFTGQKDHPDDDIKKVQLYIEQHYEERISVNDLCRKFFMGRRTFERRFKKATGNTIVEYVQRVRVEAAKRELEKSRKTVNEVMFEVGYSDTQAFRQVFKKYAGLAPVAYRERYASLVSQALSA